MTRSINRLSAVQVKSLKKKGLHADGGGLYLRISDGGTKGWMFRFSLNRRARQMGLGPIQTVSLAEARIEAEQCRKLLRDGIDPIENRNSERGRRQAQNAKVISFKECGEAFILAHSPGWKNAKHSSQWSITLETYVYPVFGNLPVSEVDVGLVLKVLEPIWETKTETASRIRGRIENVIDWATAREYREGSNPARWKGRLDKLLPAPSKVQKVIHHPALPYEDMNEFMIALRSREGLSARGLEFTILTAARTGEVLGAQWNEIDLDKEVWIIPANRMKMGSEHRVPLSQCAMKILEGMKTISSSGYVFPGRDSEHPLSNMVFLQLLKRMKRGDLTVHGFRSTFRDWVAERTSYPRDVAEMALAHAIGDKVEAAYRRGDLFDKRKRMMRDWATYCSMPPGGEVVPIQQANN
jgi:integrase